MKTKYRVYEAPDGSCPTFCGEWDTYEEAVDEAEKEPGGLPEALWETAYKAGHVCGFKGPEGGKEDDEPISWHGKEGWHCVCAVHYED